MCRRAAAIGTDGGSEADRALLDLAAALEREADELEGKRRPPKPPSATH